MYTNGKWLHHTHTYPIGNTKELHFVMYQKLSQARTFSSYAMSEEDKPHIIFSYKKKKKIHDIHIKHMARRNPQAWENSGNVFDTRRHKFPSIDSLSLVSGNKTWNTYSLHFFPYFLDSNFSEPFFRRNSEFPRDLIIET